MKAAEHTGGARLHNGETWDRLLESLESVVEFALRNQAPGASARFMRNLTQRLREGGVEGPRIVSTPYVNTIPPEKEAPFPGDWEMERRIKSYVPWNAMAMVVNANRTHGGLGGHISTFASSATLYEVAFNHFFRGPGGDRPGDMVYSQGHASPGVYARAFLEGRLSAEQLHNFRQELSKTGIVAGFDADGLKNTGFSEGRIGFIGYGCQGDAYISPGSSVDAGEALLDGAVIIKSRERTALWIRRDPMVSTPVCELLGNYGSYLNESGVCLNEEEAVPRCSIAEEAIPDVEAVYPPYYKVRFE